MTPERVVIGDAELWRGRWEDVYETFPMDAAIVSDPPYGMDWGTDTTRFSGGYNRWRHGTGRNDHRPIPGDDRPFDPTPWLTFRQVILWGSNHFSQWLPVGTTLVWLKRFDAAFGAFLSDAEIAWMKGNHGVYCFRDLSMNGQNLAKHHPCQKPLPLLHWCVEKTTGTVIDPFMGSGTTLVACVQLGRPCVGVECEERYFQVACRRIEDAYQQLALFPPPIPTLPPTQLAFADRRP